MFALVVRRRVALSSLCPSTRPPESRASPINVPCAACAQPCVYMSTYALTLEVLRLATMVRAAFASVDAVVAAESSLRESEDNDECLLVPGTSAFGRG